MEGLGSPAIHIITQKPHANFVHMRRPLLHFLCCCFDVAEVVGAEVRDARADPLRGELNGARDVAVGLVRAHDHKEVGEVLHRHAQIRPGTVGPFVPHADSVVADEVDGVEGAGHGVEAAFTSALFVRRRNMWE